MKKLFQLATITALFFSPALYAYIDQPYVVLKEQFDKSTSISKFSLQTVTLTNKPADQNETSVDVETYPVKVRVGEKIPIHVDYKINIYNNSNQVKDYTVDTKVTVCDRDYALFKRTYEVKPYQQVHEGYNIYPELVTAAKPGTCYIVAKIALYGKEDDGSDLMQQNIAQDILEISK